MKTLLILATAVAAWIYLPIGDTLSDWFAQISGSGVYDSTGNPRAVLLISSRCGEPCNEASAELRRRYIDAEIVVVDLDSQGAERYGNPRTLPTLLVGRDRMQGFNGAHYASILANNFGEQALTAQEQRIFAKHFDDNGAPRIVLYGTTWCGYCNKLRGEFAGHNIEYLDYDVEKPSKQTWLLEALGIGGYPTVYVGYQRVRGTDYAAVKKLL